MELPAEVVAEIEANRKVNAIKLLRKRRGIGLTEAKSIVDGYIERNPNSLGLQAPTTEGGIGRILLLIIGVGLIVGLYMYFT